MGKSFGIWALVLTVILLAWGYDQLPRRAGEGKEMMRETHSAWPSVVLIALSLVVFAVLWLFVSEVIEA